MPDLARVMNFEKTVLRWEDEQRTYPGDVNDDEWLSWPHI
jgi:hypothetical protein